MVSEDSIIYGYKLIKSCTYVFDYTVNRKYYISIHKCSVNNLFESIDIVQDYSLKYGLVAIFVPAYMFLTPAILFTSIKYFHDLSSKKKNIRNKGLLWLSILLVKRQLADVVKLIEEYMKTSNTFYIVTLGKNPQDIDNLLETLVRENMVKACACIEIDDLANVTFNKNYLNILYEVYSVKQTSLNKYTITKEALEKTILAKMAYHYILML